MKLEASFHLKKKQYYFLPLLKSTEKTAVRGSEEAKEVLWYALSDYKGKGIKLPVMETRRNY